MNKKIMLLCTIGLLSLPLTACELPQGPNPDTMGSATKMMMGIHTPKKDSSKDDTIQKFLGFSLLLTATGGIITLQLDKQR